MRFATLIPVLAFLRGTFARPSPQSDLPKLGGVSISGCESNLDMFGNLGQSACPDAWQIPHFTSRGVNLFRIPIGWQSLVGNEVSSTSFDRVAFAEYDKLVQDALSSGAHVLIDILNSTRWNGGTSPNTDDFANLWFNIAEFYSEDIKVIFGLPNNDHNVDADTWAVTVQAAVNAIRAAGARQSIVIPAVGYSSATGWVDGNNDPILMVTDPAAVSTSDKSRLILDCHQNLDADNSGKSLECSTSALTTLASLSSWLHDNGRKAIISEISGGNTASCQFFLNEFLNHIKHDDSFIGFSASIARLSEKTYESGLVSSIGQDTLLFKNAIHPNLPNPINLPTLKPTKSKPLRTTNRYNRRQDIPSAVPVPEENFQTFSGDLGSGAPAVTQDNDSDNFVTDSQTFAVRLDAVGSSCGVQYELCLEAAQRWGWVEPLTVEGCETQRRACLNTATAAQQASGEPAPAPQNLQLFTGAIGGLPDTVYQVTGSYVTAGVIFGDEVTAIGSSCYSQRDSCLNAADGSTCVTQLNSCLLLAAGQPVNLQAWTGDIGGTAAPVYQRGDVYFTGGIPFPDLSSALSSSCYYQRDSCGGVADATTCSEQVDACLQLANGGPPTNLQTFTGAVGGPAPAVIQNNNGFTTGGTSFPDRFAAVRSSCYAQNDACNAVAAATTCSNQVNACLTVASGATPSTNLQTFIGTIGGVAPGVYADANGFNSGGTVFADRSTALGSSCYTQLDACNGVAASNVCTDQVNACLALASAPPPTPVNLQTFTSSYGGEPPAVFQEGNDFVTGGVIFADKLSALTSSCYQQLQNCNVNFGDQAVCQNQVTSCLDIAAGRTENLQTFTATLGNIAPAVYREGDTYVSGATVAPTRLAAVTSSCYTQRGSCLATGLGDACEEQVNACLQLASETQDSAQRRSIRRSRWARRD